MNRVDTLKNLCLDILAKRYWVDRNQVYFVNIWGQFNDNTKALAIAYHEAFPQKKLVYEINDETEAKYIPSYITPVLKNTSRARHFKYSSYVVIDNDWGAIKKSGIGFKGKLLVWLYKQTISKKTYYISTGHGTPLKKIGCDAVNVSYDSFVTSTNTMFVLDDQSAQVAKSSTLNRISDVRIVGTPRNDVLFRNNVPGILVNGNNRILLFAPTFRTIVDDNKNKVFVGAEDYLQILSENHDNLITVLETRFGGKWKIGIRIHPGVTKTVDISRINSKIFIANESNDMADYLVKTDVLITDYSSCAFDFMLTGRPCFMFWADYDSYSANERGLYMNKADLPFNPASSFDELLENIQKFNSNNYLANVERFCSTYHFSKNKLAAETIISFIESL